jgi:predicted nucleic acid-binding protein
MSRWVVDTSPLIFLAKLNRLDLLRRSADELLVPTAVIEEVRASPEGLYFPSAVTAAWSPWTTIAILL